MLGQLDIHIQQNDVRALVHFIQKKNNNNSKWIKDLSDFGLSNGFLDISKATAPRNYIINCYYQNLKPFTSKDTKKVKRQPTE